MKSSQVSLTDCDIDGQRKQQLGLPKVFPVWSAILLLPVVRPCQNHYEHCRWTRHKVAYLGFAFGKKHICCFLIEPVGVFTPKTIRVRKNRSTIRGLRTSRARLLLSLSHMAEQASVVVLGIKVQTVLWLHVLCRRCSSTVSTWLRFLSNDAILWSWTLYTELPVIAARRRYNKKKQITCVHQCISAYVRNVQELVLNLKLQQCND